jgi:acyl-[acyl-carrier-protein] desaturase
MPLLRYWRIFESDGLDAAAQTARDELAAEVARLDARATRFTERRTAAQAGSSAAPAG